jgi:hypothetical protein
MVEPWQQLVALVGLAICFALYFGYLWGIVVGARRIVRWVSRILPW